MPKINTENVQKLFEATLNRLDWGKIVICCKALGLQVDDQIPNETNLQNLAKHLHERIMQNISLDQTRSFFFAAKNSLELSYHATSDWYDISFVPVHYGINTRRLARAT